MSANDNDNGKPSRLTRHLHLLGVEPKPGLEPESLAREKKLMDTVGDLPSLDFTQGETHLAPPGAKGRGRGMRGNWLAAGVGLAFAATTTFLIVRPDHGDRDNRDNLGDVVDSGQSGIRIKGDIGAAAVYVDQEGEIGPLTPGMILESGAKVRVELVAHEDAFGYMTVVDRHSKLLTEATSLRLTLRASEKATFPGALELTGASEGETILVLICPIAVESVVTPTDVAAAFQNRQVDGALASCKLEAVPLR